MAIRNAWSRYVLCPLCTRKEKFQLHPSDAVIGYKERRVKITTVMPGLRRVHCDGCMRVLIDELPNCMCVTHWRGQEPLQWEHDYGTIQESNNGTNQPAQTNRDAASKEDVRNVPVSNGQ